MGSANLKRDSRQLCDGLYKGATGEIGERDGKEAYVTHEIHEEWH